MLVTLVGVTVGIMLPTSVMVSLLVVAALMLFVVVFPLLMLWLSPYNVVWLSWLPRALSWAGREVCFSASVKVAIAITRLTRAWENDAAVTMVIAEMLRDAFSCGPICEEDVMFGMIELSTSDGRGHGYY